MLFGADIAMELVLTPFIAAIVGAVASLVFSRVVRRAGDSASEIRALKAGMRTLLRNELVVAHREYAEERRCITLEALEYVEETFESYHDLGGDGSGAKLWEDIKALPIKN